MAESVQMVLFQLEFVEPQLSDRDIDSGSGGGVLATTLRMFNMKIKWKYRAKILRWKQMKQSEESNDKLAQLKFLEVSFESISERWL